MNKQRIHVQWEEACNQFAGCPATACGGCECTARQVKDKIAIRFEKLAREINEQYQ